MKSRKSETKTKEQSGTQAETETSFAISGAPGAAAVATAANETGSLFTGGSEGALLSTTPLASAFGEPCIRSESAICDIFSFERVPLSTWQAIEDGQGWFHGCYSVPYRCH